MVDISADGHRVRLTFPSAEGLPNPGAYTVTMRACTDALIGTQFACHETDDGPAIIMYAMTTRGRSDGVPALPVRACVNLAIGTLRACHELASNGSNTYPDLIVYALSPRVVE